LSTPAPRTTPRSRWSCGVLGRATWPRSLPRTPLGERTSCAIRDQGGQEPKPYPTGHPLGPGRSWSGLWGSDLIGF
jgi:hypothetical protein